MLEPYLKTKQIIIGLDLGQQQDYSALSVVEIKQKYIPILAPAGELQLDYGKYQPESEPFHYVRSLTRYPLGTPYPEIVRLVSNFHGEIINTQKMKPVLVIDATGVGRPVFDMFYEIGLKPKGISIHGGAVVTRDKNIFHVPKRDLVGVLQVLYQNQRIKISGHLPGKEILNKELLNFRVKISDSGHDTYEAWREKDHDDMVLSIACACWYGEKMIGKRINSINKKALGS